MSATVTIGLPTYNRPDYLRQAVDSLLAQTFSDFKLIISDNASEDPSVGELIDEFIAADDRVSAVRRPVNIGAELNFRGLMKDCQTPFFMWAADDDIWEPNFLEVTLEMLSKNPLAQMAAGMIDNINAAGVTIRRYEKFSRFTAGKSRVSDACRFILDPEILGKANLIYGLFRTPALQEVCATNWTKAGFAEWGGDNVLLFAFISRHPIVACDAVLIHKRVPTDSDEAVQIEHPQLYFVPKSDYKSYVRRHIEVAPSLDVALRARCLLLRRNIAQKALMLARQLRLYFTPRLQEIRKRLRQRK